MDIISRDCPFCKAKFRTDFPIFQVADGCAIIVCAECGVAYGNKNINENFKILEAFNGIENGTKQ
jgi:glutaredoxin